MLTETNRVEYQDRPYKCLFMIKVSDFIFQYLVEKYNIHHCFMVTGGGAMHLNDSIGHTKGLTYICNHHEHFIIPPSVKEVAGSSRMAFLISCSIFTEVSDSIKEKS